MRSEIFSYFHIFQPRADPARGGAFDIFLARLLWNLLIDDR